MDMAQGYGRVFPEHKWAIVKSAQELGHIVGMTGDGVNDAPALKQADVGIAVSGATAAARAAASLILTAPGLSVIIRGIEEARRTFARMMGYAYYRVAMTLNIMVFIVLGVVLFNFQALTPIMIIVLALLDDVPVMLIAFDNADGRAEAGEVGHASGDVHQLDPVGGGDRAEHWTAPPPASDLHLPLDQIQTGMFMQLVIGGHLLLFSTRSQGAVLETATSRGQAVLGDPWDADFRCADGRERMADSGDSVGADRLHLVVQPGVAVCRGLGKDGHESVDRSLGEEWERWLRPYGHSGCARS